MFLQIPPSSLLETTLWRDILHGKASRPLNIFRAFCAVSGRKGHSDKILLRTCTRSALLWSTIHFLYERLDRYFQKKFKDFKINVYHYLHTLQSLYTYSCILHVESNIPLIDNKFSFLSDSFCFVFLSYPAYIKTLLN